MEAISWQGPSETKKGDSARKKERVKRYDLFVIV